MRAMTYTLRPLSSLCKHKSNQGSKDCACRTSQDDDTGAITGLASRTFCYLKPTPMPAKGWRQFAKTRPCRITGNV